MYWKFDSGKVSQIDTILENENVSLNEILEQEDIIQECKNQNKKLVDFLAKTEVIAQLLDLILMEPDEEIDEKIRYKLPNIASELITCDIQAINESLVGNTQLMDRMISFLDTKTTLNPLLSSFFSKAFGVLITRRSDQNWYSYQFTTVQVLTYIKTRPGFTGLLLRHVHTSAVMDLLLRLITCVEGKENREMILKWLNDEKLIEDIIQLFSSKQQPLDSTEALSDNPQQLQEDQEALGQEPEVGVGQEVEGAGERVGQEGEGAGEGVGQEGDGEDEPMSVETDEPVATTNPTEEKTYEELMNEKDKHDNAGQLLVEIIRVSRDALLAPTDDNFLDNSLLLTAESKQTAELLLDVMLEAPLRESVIVNGISVLLVLLEVRKPAPQGQAHYPYTSDQDNLPNTAELARQEQVMIQTVEAIIPRLPDLVSILSNPPTKPPVHTTAGILDPPLGPTRLAICKLMAAILGTQVSVLNPALAQTSFLSSILNLFFKYSLNNFLHLQTLSCLRSILTWKARPPPTPLNTTAENVDEPPVDDVLQTPKVTLNTTNPPEPCEADTADAVLELPENPLLLQLFTDARLLELLVRAWNMEFTPNISYMGHITQICNQIEEVRKGSEDLMENTYNRVLLNQLFEKLSPEEKGAWDEILSGKLAETNKRNEIPPTREDRRNLSSDDDSDFRDIHFPQDTALQQIQQMSENFVETFGYNDDDFNDAEDGVRGLGKMSPAVNFLMNTDDNTKKAIFESICEGRPTRGEVDSDEEDDEDIWAERTAELSFGGRNNADISKDEGKDENDSSEEEENVQMEVDVDPWASTSTIAAAPIAMDTSVPWVEDGEATQKGGPGWASFEQPKPEEAGGWADFGQLSSAGGEGFASFGAFGEETAVRDKQDEWSPVMSSSPEATMLDNSELVLSPEKGSRPLQNLSEASIEEQDLSSERRPESPDLSNCDANQAPVPSDVGEKPNPDSVPQFQMSDIESEVVQQTPPQPEQPPAHVDASAGVDASANVDAAPQPEATPAAPQPEEAAQEAAQTEPDSSTADDNVSGEP